MIYLGQLCAEIMNKLLGVRMPTPNHIEPGCGLFIFGYDRDQLQGRFKDFLEKDGSLDGVNYYSIGGIQHLNLNTLWNALMK